MSAKKPGSQKQKQVLREVRQVPEQTLGSTCVRKGLSMRKTGAQVPITHSQSMEKFYGGMAAARDLNSSFLVHFYEIRWVDSKLCRENT